MRYLLIIMVFPVIFSGGCKRPGLPAEGAVNTTVIDYKVEYLDSKAGNIPTSVLPSRMSAAFAGHFAMNRIDGFLGQFSLKYIANLRTRTVITMLKLFDKKYYYDGKPGEFPCGIIALENLQINKTGAEKEISGFFASEFIARTDDDKEFLVYAAYIDNIKNPNITTPYREINKVLLEFYTTLSVLQMKLSATRIYEKELDWSYFNIPGDYKQITKDEMESLLTELFK